MIILIVLLNTVFIHAEEKKIKIEDKETQIDTGNQQKVSVSNVEIEKISSGTKVVLNEKSIIKVSYNGKEYQYSELGKVDNKDPYIIFKNGIINEAIFSVNKEGEYVIGNEKVFLGKGAIVIFKDGKVSVTVPEGSVIKAPEKIDKTKAGLEFSFNGKDNKAYWLNDKFFYGNINFKDGNFYFTGDLITKEVTIKNPEGVKTYIDFKGEVNKYYDSAYISIDSNKIKIVIGNNGDKPGPAILFNQNPDNAFGVLVESTDHFSVKAAGKGSYIMIDEAGRTNQGKVPLGEVVGDVLINQDNKGIYTKDNKIFLRTNGLVMDEFGTIGSKDVEIEKGAKLLEGSTTTVPMVLDFFKINEKGEKVPITNGNKFVVGNFIDFGFGPNPEFIEGESYKINPSTGMSEVSPYKLEKTLLLKGVSEKLTYNYPSIQDFEKTTGITISPPFARQSLTPLNIKMLYDLYNSLTPELKSNVKLINFDANSGTSYYNSNTKSINTRTVLLLKDFRHEIMHGLDYSLIAQGSEFESDWNLVSPYKTRGVTDPNYQRRYAPADKGFAYGYGETTDLEDKATFGDLIYSPEYLKTLLSDSNDYSYIYRAKMALLYKYGFISQREFDSAFKAAGLETSKEWVQYYIDNAKYISKYGKQKN